MDKLIIFLLIICGAFVLTILVLVQNEDVSYEEALLKCSKINSINERDYCRMITTEKYR